MTLEDALQGLKNYWNLRPNGGTRTELIALARLKGFEEPLLNTWLDVFLTGFRDQGRIPTTTYRDLAAFVESVGPTIASRAAESVFVYLIRPGSELDRVRKLDRANATTAKIVTFQDEVTLLASAVTAASTALAAHPGLALFQVAIKPGVDAFANRLAGATAERDRLLAEIA